MVERWAGVCVSSSKVIVVAFQVDEDDNIEMIFEGKWPLQNGDRHDAYGRMHEQVTNFLQEKKISHARV